MFDLMRIPKELWRWYDMARAREAFQRYARRTGLQLQFSSEAAHLTDPRTGQQWSYDLGPENPDDYATWLANLRRH